jgi:putative heme-binding domain-containing protein
MTLKWERIGAAGAILVFLLALALPARAQNAADHQYSSADVEAGSRLYATQCSLCHGPNGELVNGVDLRLGRFRRAVSDDDLAKVIQTGVPAAGMPPFNLSPPEIGTLVAFIRAGFDVSGTAVKIGNPGRGQTVFAGKGACATCHRVNGVGPRSAPDLSDIGAVRSPAALQRSLLNPTSAMWPINRPVTLITRDGQTIRGRRLNEDTFTVQIIDDQERLRSFDKAGLRELQVATTSTMPSVQGKLSADEVADLIGYLLSLKGLP